MKRTLIAAALLLTATSAHANWTAFYEPKNSDGKPMCGMRYADDRGSIMVKHVLGTRDQFFVQYFSQAWAGVPNGTTVPFFLAFDGKVYGKDNAWGGNGLISIHIGDTPRFLDWFTKAHRMTFGFMLHSSAPWSVDLTRSREALIEFDKCFRR